MLSPFDELLFQVDCSIRYHSKRRRFFENVQQWALFVGFMFATGAVANLMDKIGSEWASVSLSLVGAAFVGVAIVSRAGAKANDHNDLKRRFIRLQQDMERGRGRATGDQVTEWTAERLAIEADEPPVNKVVHAVSYNDLVRSKWPGEIENPRFVVIKWRHRLLGWATRAFDSSLQLGEPVERAW